MHVHAMAIICHIFGYHLKYSKPTERFYVTCGKNRIPLYHVEITDPYFVMEPVIKLPSNPKKQDVALRRIRRTETMRNMLNAFVDVVTEHPDEDVDVRILFNRILPDDIPTPMDMPRHRI